MQPPLQHLRPYLCACFVFLLTIPLHAQFETGAVLGTIHDATGASVSAARVELENTQTGVRQSAVSDDSGNYLFQSVRIGNYRVRAQAQGFQTAVSKDFDLTVNSRQRVDLSLQVGNTSESVTVSAEAPVIESETSDRGQVITNAAIVNLPLNGRAYADLALLVPGVRRSVLNNQTITSRDASFNVNGLRSSLNNFLIDGVDNNSYGTSNQGFSNQIVQVNPDAVAEFKVQTNNYSAEYGRAGGAIINVSTRSGTNALHGSAWEFLRNTNLNAVGFFKPLGGVKPVFIQNQFGGAIGGPIKKDKLFFFGDYEGFRRVSRTLTFATIPTDAQRAGNIGVPVQNPLTGKVYANGIIPQEDMSPFARVVLADLPSPNLLGNANNYQSLPRGSLQDDKGDGRIDYYFTERLSFFGRYSHRLANVFDPPNIPGPSGGNSNGNTRILNWQVAPGITWAMSSSSVVEMRVGISKTEGGKTPPGLGLPIDRYNIPNLPSDPSFAGGLYTVSINGFSQFGRQNSNPQHQNPFLVNPKVNYSKAMGRHSLKLGYEYQAINTEVEDFHPKYGQDTYAGQFSRPAGSPTGTGALQLAYTLTDFMFGLRSNYQLNNYAVVDLRQRMHFGYIQDDWKASDRLTLNLGVRYEFATPQWVADNRLANFDPAILSLIQAKNGSIYDRALVDPDRNNFAPRIGLAYRLFNRTAIRSAYGISYIHFNRMGGENLLAYNGPNIVGVSIDQTPSQPVCGASEFRSCFRPTQLGYPASFAVPANYNPLIARVNYIPRDFKTPYVQTWHFTIQQELAHDLVLDVAYVGNRGNGLMILGDYNQAVPNVVGQSLSLQARRPFQNYSIIQEAWGGGFSTYHALQTKIEKRYSRGVYFLNSFTWSKAMDNAAGHLEANNGDNSRVNIRNLPAEKGLSNYNQPLNNTTTLLWETPYGRGRRWGSDANAFVQGVFGGWRLSLINSATNGLPINITYSPSSQFQVSSLPSYRPNLTGASLYPAQGQGPTNWLDRTAVAVPTDPSQPFGNAGRNIAVGPNFWQVDLGLHKDFPLWSESSRLEFRTEAFNLLNRTNFQIPDSNASNTTYGRITSTFPARQIQFGLKLLF